MRIAIITKEFPPAFGGVEEYLGHVAHGLSARHTVRVWAPGGHASAGESTPYDLVPLPRMLWRLIRQLRGWGPDRIVVGHTDLHLLLAARLALPEGYVAIAYGNDFLAAQRLWYRPLVNRLLAAASKVITISHYSARRLQTLGIENPHVIHPGTDPSRFTPPSTPPPGPLTLLSVGRLVRRKGLDVALRALRRLRDDFPHLRYLVVGRGPERRGLQKLAQRLGLDGHVHFLGAVPAAELPDVYRQAHVFLLPLRPEAPGDSVESFGMVFLEAAATAVPSVAGNSGGAAEAVRDGETGFVVEPGDEEAVYHATRQLLADEALRQQMGRHGRRWVEEVMNWDRVVAQFESVLAS